ncbi:MAG: hypothetical protein HWE11_09005 [Gammaproteobacteria bacterium]|nr:hypothetical protein [Gammaproteobacteria bacterium]
MEHIPYGKGELPDFVVEYRWKPEKEVSMCKPFQGIRSDFLYEGDNPKSDGIHMIWPEFLDYSGNVILQKETEVEEKGFANMWILMKERASYHNERIKVGTKGYMVVGSKILEASGDTHFLG